MLYNSSPPTLRSLAIFVRGSMSGCEELVHHLETVDGLTPSSSDNHLLGALNHIINIAGPPFFFQSTLISGDLRPALLLICCLGVKLVKNTQSTAQRTPFLVNQISFM